MSIANKKFDTDPNPYLLNSIAEAHLDIRDHLGDGIFLLKDGDLGIVWEINGIYDENKEEEDLLEEFSFLQKFLRIVSPGIPAHLNKGNTASQIICSSRRIQKPPLNSINGKIHNFSGSLAGEILKAEEEYLFKSLNFVERRFFLTLRYTPKVDERNLREKFLDYFKNKKFLDLFQEQIVLNEELSEIDDALKLFTEEISNLENILIEQGKISRLFPQELIAYIQNVLSSSSIRPVYPYDSNINLYTNTPPIKVDAKGIVNEDGGSTEIYYLDQLPKDYSYGIFRHFMDSIPHTDFDLVWNFTYGSNQTRKDLRSREAYLGGKKSRERDAAEFIQFRENISTFNPYGTQSVRLLVHNPPSGFESKLQSVASDYIGCNMPREKQIPIHMLITSLPLGANRRGNGLKGRSRVIRLDAALGFVPIYSGPPSGDGIIWRQSRSGTPTKFDLFAGDGNKMTTAVGTSRVGKSVFTNLLALEFLERYPEGVIRGSDIRTSYLKLTEICGGRIVKFSEEELRKEPYSPFAFETWTESDMENLKYLISAVIVAKNSDACISDIHSNLLKQAIHLAYNSQRKLIQAKISGEIKGEISTHPTWDKVVSQFPEAKKELEKSGTGKLDYVVEDIQKWTMSLTKTGEYGFIFSEKQSIKDSSNSERILIYDMDGIEDPVLRQIASMMANMKIMRDISRMPRNVRKLIIFDELGQQVRGTDKSNSGSSYKAQEIMGEMMINIVATAAKMNTQVIALTNQVTDYTENPSGRALWSISEQQIFLPMGKLFKRAHEEWGSDFNTAEWSIIRSLRKEKQKFRSAIYISSNNDTAPFKGSSFLPLSPLMDALTTTSGSQIELYNTLKSNGLSPIAALQHMVEKHPYGNGLNNEGIEEKIDTNDPIDESNEDK